MLGDCHIHMVLDGRIGWKEAMDRHSEGACEEAVRNYLKQYQKAGMRFLRDGGDKFGVSALAKQLAPEYDITYVTPISPLYQKGHYGSFIGRGFENVGEYRAQLAMLHAEGADFVKLMLSGLVDFDHYGVMKGDPLESGMIRELIHIAHEEGFAVMSHCSGAEPCMAAIEAGTDSLEHGFYLDQNAQHALAESDTVWVPTLVTVGNLTTDDRHPAEVTKRILDEQLWKVSTVAGWGGNIALGSDAGAYRVPHVQGALDEYDLLREEIGEEDIDPILETGEAMIRWKFGGAAAL